MIKQKLTDTDNKFIRIEKEIIGYCKKMGWDPKNLSPDQVLKLAQEIKKENDS